MPNLDKTIHIMNSGVCTGKTTSVVKKIADLDHRAVYLVPAYEELNRFESEWKKLNSKKKVVVLKGKRKLCPLRRYTCNKCAYTCNKCALHSEKCLIPLHPDDYFYSEKLYDPERYCPYYNLLNEAKDADVILTHYLLLEELYQINKMPYNPEETWLFIDEGEKVLHSLSPKPWLVYTLSSEFPLDWTNLSEQEYFRPFWGMINGLMNGLRNHFPSIEYLFDFYMKTFDPKQYYEKATKDKDNVKPLWAVLEAEIPQINDMLFRQSLEFRKSLGEVRINDIKRQVKKTFGRSNDTNLFLEWLDMMANCPEVIINTDYQNPNRHEVYLRSFPYALDDWLLKTHRGVTFISGSFTSDDINLLKIYVKDVIIERPATTFTHPHVLILHSERYNSFKLVYQLDKEKYTTFVTHSSEKKANDYTSTLMKVPIFTPKNITGLTELQQKGCHTFNLIQGSSMALNNRLDGDVAIVNTFVGKDIDNYGSPLLEEKCVIRDTYQAVGRIINNDGRPVVIVMEKKVYELSKEKWDEHQATVKSFATEEEAINEIKQWIKIPVMASKTIVDKKDGYYAEYIVTAKPFQARAKGHCYERSRIGVNVYRFKEDIGKKYRVTIKEVD